MNYENKPKIQPSNYTQTNISPPNYNFNQQHQYDVAKKNPLNYTQSDISPMTYNFNQQHQYDVAKENSSKYPNTYKPTNNNTQTDPILDSSKYTNSYKTYT